MNRPWGRALGYALTGRSLALPESAAPDVPGTVAELDALGWDGARVREHALATVAAGERWPHLIPDDLRAGLGAAQLHASLTRLREGLGLVTLDVRAPSRRTALTADERRLLAEVPPHHVH